MSYAEGDRLSVGESLSLSSLVSANGAFALTHRSDGTAVLQAGSDGSVIWTLGEPGSHPVCPRLNARAGVSAAGTAFRSMRPTVGSSPPPAQAPRSGQLALRDEGYLTLESATGDCLWCSGPVDRRVTAAVLTDTGRLLLVDPDGHPRWTRDPLTDDDLAAYKPATGDRLRPGQALVEPLLSRNGRYRLSHDAQHGLTLSRTSGGDVWNHGAGPLGHRLSLGADGVLRVDANSTVLPRWSGRRWDPMNFVVSALLVQDDGDVVILGDDGADLWTSQTSAEEAYLQELRRKEARTKQKPARPAGSGLSIDWLEALVLPEAWTITLVQGVDTQEALFRLGVDLRTIRPTTFEAAGTAVFAGADAVSPQVLAVPIDGWVMLVELGGEEGREHLTQMSARTRAITYSVNYDAVEFFGCARDGVLQAEYDDENDSNFEDGKRAEVGAEPKVALAFMRQIGLGRYRPDEAGFLPPGLEVACLMAEIRPQPHHFAGSHLGAARSSLNG